MGTHTDTYKAFQASGLVSNITDEPFFSHRRCDVCNGLPGDRYTVQGYRTLAEAREEKHKGDNLYQLELCQDCYMELFT